MSLWKLSFFTVSLAGLMCSTTNAQSQPRRPQQPVEIKPIVEHRTIHHHHGGGGGWGWGWRGGWGWGGHHGWGGRYHHASTAAEGYLSGLGDLYRGQGFFLMAKGRYFIDYERARKLYINNRKLGIRSWWEIRDEWKERLHRDNPDYVTREHKRLDMLEKMHALEQRKKELMEAGIMPKPPEPAFYYQGEKFSSYEDFKTSPKYAQLKTDARMQTMMYELEQKAEEQRRASALRFMAMWNNMSFLERHSYVQQRKVDEILSQPFTGTPKYEVKPLKN